MVALLIVKGLLLVVVIDCVAPDKVYTPVPEVNVPLLVIVPLIVTAPFMELFQVPLLVRLAMVKLVGAIESFTVPLLLMVTLPMLRLPVALAKFRFPVTVVPPVTTSEVVNGVRYKLPEVTDNTPDTVVVVLVLVITVW